MMDPIVINIPDTEWESAGLFDGSRLLSKRSLLINGAFLHLEAIAIDRDAEGHQYFVGGSDEEEAAILGTLVQDDAVTTMIMGREYVLVATPHQE